MFDGGGGGGGHEEQEGEGGEQEAAGLGAAAAAADDKASLPSFLPSVRPSHPPTDLIVLPTRSRAAAAALGNSADSVCSARLPQSQARWRRGGGSMRRRERAAAYVTLFGPASAAAVVSPLLPSITAAEAVPR